MKTPTTALPAKILSAVGLVALGALVGGGTARLASADFDVVTARRINVVDGDGTVRLALFNGSRTPDARIRGKVYPRSIGNTAGFIMFDPAGKEVGGLATSRMSGSTDQYMMVFDYAHQPTDGVQIGRTESADGKTYSGGVFIADRRAFQPGPIASTQGVQRIALATRDGDSGLVISGTDGKPRIRIGVDAGNQARFEILNGKGEVVRSLN